MTHGLTTKASQKNSMPKFYERLNEIPGITEKGTSREGGTVGTDRSLGVKSGFTLTNRAKRSRP